MSRPKLTAVTGIGPATAKHLAAHGLDSVKVLAAASIEDIAAVPGFGPARGAAVRLAAASLLATSEPETPATPVETTVAVDPPAKQAVASQPRSKTKKKKKKKKKKPIESTPSKKSKSRNKKKSAKKLHKSASKPKDKKVNDKKTDGKKKSKKTDGKKKSKKTDSKKTDGKKKSKKAKSKRK